MGASYKAEPGRTERGLPNPSIHPTQLDLAVDIKQLATELKMMFTV